ncbi:MAG: hypothetical protein ABEJ05_01065 [Haloglomus sp.]
MSGRPPEVDRAYEHLDNVETEVHGTLPDKSEELESLRASIEEYEELEDHSDRVKLLDAIDQEIDEVRDWIDREIDDGAEAAHDAVGKLEREIDSLRERLGS